MDRTEMNASPVQKALQGIKKYKYVLLTALLGVLLLLLPQNEKATDTGSATPPRKISTARRCKTRWRIFFPRSTASGSSHLC